MSNKKSNKPKTKPRTNATAKAEPKTIHGEPDNQQEHVCEYEYEKRAFHLLKVLLDLAEMAELNEMEIARCLFRAGHIVLDPEMCDDCVTELFDESRQFAADHFQGATEEEQEEHAAPSNSN